MVSYPKKTSAEWFIDQINVENAKLVAFVLVIGFIGYHGILHLRYGPDSCTWLLSSGRYKGDHEWQPYGCMLHRYSKTDARRCFRYLAFWGKYNSFAFIGDSRLEQLYEYFIVGAEWGLLYPKHNLFLVRRWVEKIRLTSICLGGFIFIGIMFWSEFFIAIC